MPHRIEYVPTSVPIRPQELIVGDMVEVQFFVWNGTSSKEEWRIARVIRAPNADGTIGVQYRDETREMILRPRWR